MAAPLELVKVPVRSDATPKAPSSYFAEWLSKDQQPEWDAFVQGHPLGSVYHTSEWKRVIEQAFGHIRGRFLALRENESGRIHAGLPIYQVRSWLLGSRLVSVPFATVCNPLVTTLEEWGALAPELESERNRTRRNKLEIRAAASSAQLPPSFQKKLLFRQHTLPLDADFDDLCMHFDKKSVRQKAEKARKAGVIVKERSDFGGMGISHSLLAATRRRLSLPPMPYRFFEAMQRNLRADHLKIFLAFQDAHPIACHVVLIFKDKWISEYSGNADGTMSGVNQLLYLETIRRACAEGAREFSFGRTSMHNEGLLSYKRRWGTIEEKLTDYTSRRDHRTAKEAQVSEDAPASEDSRLYRLCRQVIARVPMPVCKMVGDFCYRHLG